MGDGIEFSYPEEGCILMRDVQSERDRRNIHIDSVGVTGLAYPIVVRDKHEKTQHTVATVEMAVSLTKDYRGTHMSRFIEILNSCNGHITLQNLENIAQSLRRHLGAGRAEVEFRFPYFASRQAPVSGASSFTRYDVIFWAARDDNFDFTLTVSVPVTTLCPCSREISQNGAHNQRAEVRMTVRMNRLVWIEDLADVAEQSASSPVFTLLKRDDEKFVTEKAYDTPRFVEDVVREVAARLDVDPRIDWYTVTVTSHESIHAHDAFASLSRDKKAQDKELIEKGGNQ
jgi:GTP cyclohydrolase I